MTKIMLMLALSASALLLAAVGAFISAAPQGDAPTAAAQPSRQPATTLSVPSCTEVNAGDIFTMPIRVDGVQNLLAWEAYLTYDRDILRVEARDVRIFLTIASGSNVLDISDPVPNSSGIYRMAAADLAVPTAPESGSGVLATVTIIAIQNGVSAVSLEPIDFNGDGTPDLGPTLTNTDGEQIGDENGDGIFDADNTFSGQIAAGQPCVTPAPTVPLPPIMPIVGDVGDAPQTPTTGQTPGSDDGGSSPSDGEGAGADGATAAADTQGREQTQGAGGISEGDAGDAGDGGSTGDESDDGGASSDGGGLSPWLAAAVGGAALIGLIVAYTIIRTARRRPV